MKRVCLLLVALIACNIAICQFHLTPTGFQSKEGKDYIIKDYEGKTAAQLYSAVLTNINTIYNDGKYVSSKAENNSINIDALMPYIRCFSGMRFGGVFCDIYYKLVFEFKDGKIRISSPLLKRIISTPSGTPGTEYVISSFFTKHQLVKKVGITSLDYEFNSLLDKITNIKKSDW